MGTVGVANPRSRKLAQPLKQQNMLAIDAIQQLQIKTNFEVRLQRSK